jgi:trans-2,3-dihydro-3-hydroxyanthranilate isomerase
MEHAITWVEVFAEQPLGGNLLPVITDADDADDAAMAAVARRFQQSETSFVQRATDGVADYRHRIFMVTGEIPFAGHPSLGTAAVVAHRAGSASASYVQQTGAGRQRLDVLLDGAVGRVTLTQNPAEFGPTADPAPILVALGIAPTAQRSDLPPQIVSTGLPTLIVPLTDLAELTAATVDRDRLRRALEQVAGSSAPRRAAGRGGRGRSHPPCQRARIRPPARQRGPSGPTSTATPGPPSRSSTRVSRWDPPAAWRST